jgi:hypothetical protein
MTFTPPLLREVFSGHLIIFIGLELIKTIVMSYDEQLARWRWSSVAMIAIARHLSIWT